MDHKGTLIFHKRGKRLFVTGKNWNKMFEVRVVEGDAKMPWADVKKRCVPSGNIFRPR